MHVNEVGYESRFDNTRPHLRTLKRRRGVINGTGSDKKGTNQSENDPTIDETIQVFEFGVLFVNEFGRIRWVFSFGQVFYNGSLDSLYTPSESVQQNEGKYLRFY